MLSQRDSERVRTPCLRRQLSLNPGRGRNRWRKREKRKREREREREERLPVVKDGEKENES